MIFERPQKKKSQKTDDPFVRKMSALAQPPLSMRTHHEKKPKFFAAKSADVRI